MLNFKNPIHSSLRIFGLAIAITATLLKMKVAFIIGMILDMNYMENVDVILVNPVVNLIKYSINHQEYFMDLKAPIYYLLGDGLSYYLWLLL